MKMKGILTCIASLFIFYSNAQDAYSFNDSIMGDYIAEDNHVIVIGRSQRRPYIYFENTGAYRALRKIDDHTWTAGSTIISDSITQKFIFHDKKLEIFQNEKLISTASKKDFYRSENISYLNPSNETLGATLFLPNIPNGKGIVLVHGSGAQDRNGYAGTIRLLADILARDGTTVLTYDKQGVGSSTGNWEVQSFAQLAKDALAGLHYLKKRKDLNLEKTGLGGSSQAGWVIAKATGLSDDVDFALTISAGGSGLTVIEQNLYNTKVSMQCSGRFSKTQMDNALTQQQFFFDYILHRNNGDILKKFTADLSSDSLVRDWLFPTPGQIDFNNRKNWYLALEIDFNPVDAWRNYNKPVLMTFSEFDDQTPTVTEKKIIEKINKKNIKVIVFPGSQHNGLITDSVCKGDLTQLSKFHKDFFARIKKWIQDI